MTRAGLRPIARQTRAYFAPVDRVNGPTRFSILRKTAGFCWMLPWLPGLTWDGLKTFNARAHRRSHRWRAGRRVRFRRRRGTRWGAHRFRISRLGKVADGAGGRRGAHERAGDERDRIASGVGRVPIPAVPLLAGSTALELVLGAGAVAGFEAGNLLACDVDYAQQVGYVGSGIAAAYVSNSSNVQDDANYVRRVTFNVGRVALVTATSLLLTQPLAGGVPATGAAVQQVIAFVDREGGAFLQQWSGLFVAEDESGGRVCFYYPILSPCTVKAEWARESVVLIQKPIGELALQASFTALPTVDTNDGAVVLGYRSYFPAAGAAAY